MIIPSFKIIQIINIVALLFLVFGAYGIAITGFLQVIAALGFLILFPSNKLIYIYFALVIFFFSFWNGTLEDWFFIIPIFLIFYLTFIIYSQKKMLKKKKTHQL